MLKRSAPIATRKRIVFFTLITCKLALQTWIVTASRSAAESALSPTLQTPCDNGLRGVVPSQVSPYQNPDVKDVALVVTVLRAGNDNLTADDSAEKLLKLGSFLPDARLDNIGMLNAFEGDLKWGLHRKPRRTSTVRYSIGIAPTNPTPFH